MVSYVHRPVVLPPRENPQKSSYQFFFITEVLFCYKTIPNFAIKPLISSDTTMDFNDHCFYYSVQTLEIEVKQLSLKKNVNSWQLGSTWAESSGAPVSYHTPTFVGY